MASTSWVNENRGAAARWAAVGALVLASVGFLAHSLLGEDPKPGSETPTRVEIERVLSGHSVKVESGERLIYAGIRAPYEHEPLFEKAKQRNAELVQGKTVRLRFDRQRRDRKERLWAYVFVDSEFVNERLVREGLAYCRLTPDTRRFAQRLLAAQADAREYERGIWERQPKSAESTYPADPKHAWFHRPSCEKAANIKPERLLSFSARDEALDQGFAPCDRCMP